MGSAQVAHLFDAPGGPVPWLKIQRANLNNQFRRAERHLVRQTCGARIELRRKRITDEYEALREAVVTWADLREKLSEAERAMFERRERRLMQSPTKQLDYGLRLRARRVRALSAQRG
jgi:hypothetical protein